MVRDFDGSRLPLPQVTAMRNRSRSLRVSSYLCRDASTDAASIFDGVEMPFYAKAKGFMTVSFFYGDEMPRGGSAIASYF